jgi:hypothetical protein
MKKATIVLCQLAIIVGCLIFSSNQVSAQSSVVTLQGNLSVYPKDMGNMNYSEALEVCQTLNSSNSFGFSDWRLPTLSELKKVTSSGGKVKGILLRKRYGSLEGILDLKDQTVDRNLDWREREFNFRPVRTDKEPVVSAEPIELNLSPFEINFQQGGGSQIMVIITNSDDWAVKEYPNWCSVPSKESKMFTLNCSANTGGERTGLLVVTAGDQEAQSTIIQKAAATPIQVEQGSAYIPQPIVLEEKIETPLAKGEWREIIAQDMASGITKSNPAGAYKGQTVKNARNGLGAFLWRDDTMYLGNWEGSYGTKNGVGIYIPPAGYETDNCVNCHYFVGDWDMDLRAGNGTCYDTNGNLVYKGAFAKDRPTDTYPSTENYSAYKFESIQFADGSTYVGETFNNNPEGQGFLLYANGDIW